jgi:Membrane bound O-acyl transferase family
MLSIIGKHVAFTVCGFKPGTMASSYTQLFVAFLVSGLMHTGGDYMVFHRFTSFSSQFFLLQAIAISFEDFVLWSTKHWCARWDRRITRIIGYIWVLGWFCFAIPIWLDPLTAADLHLVERGAITTKLLDIWTSHTSSLSLTTAVAPVWLNPMNLTRLSTINPIGEIWFCFFVGELLTAITFFFPLQGTERWTREISSAKPSNFA